MSSKSRLANTGAPANGQPEESRLDQAAPETSSPAGPEADLDPFDPANLRLYPNLSTGGAVKKLLVTLRVGKPGIAQWVRVHPAEEYHVHTAVLEVKGEGKSGEEVYLVPSRMQTALSGDPCFRLCLLSLAISRQGDPFLWRINLPRDTDRNNAWSESARAAMDLATRVWVRVCANMAAGCYDVFEAQAPIPEPTWPELSPRQLLKLAFKDRFIDTLEHPILRQLQRGG